MLVFPENAATVSGRLSLSTYDWASLIIKQQKSHPCCHLQFQEAGWKGQQQGVPFQSCSLDRLSILQCAQGWSGQRTNEDDKYESEAHLRSIKSFIRNTVLAKSQAREKRKNGKLCRTWAHLISEWTEWKMIGTRGSKDAFLACFQA